MADGYDDNDLATYDPRSGLPDVGHGPGFGAALYSLYKAGQIEMPGIAQRYSAMTWTTHTTATYVQGQGPAAGNPTALTGLAELIDDLQVALRTTTLSVRDCGVALSEIALDYAGTDREAQEAFNQRIRDLDDQTDFTGGPPAIPDPPNADDPLPYVPPSETPPELDDLPDRDGPDVDLPDDDGGSGGSDGDYGSTD